MKTKAQPSSQQPSTQKSLFNLVEECRKCGLRYLHAIKTDKEKNIINLWRQSALKPMRYADCPACKSADTRVTHLYEEFLY